MYNNIYREINHGRFRHHSMLNQTLPFPLQFNPSSSPATYPAISPFSPPSNQVRMEMEWAEEKALKTSLRPERTGKLNQQVVYEEFWGGNGANGVPGDDLFVDELLDFSNEDVEGQEEEDEEKDCLSVSSSKKQSLDSSNFCLEDDFGSIPGSELSVPTDEVENLEWLSHFVEDSFSEFSMQFPAGNLQGKTQTPDQNRSEPESGTTSLKIAGFPTPVPAKARSKRSRTSGRVWSLGSPSFTESSQSSSSSSSSSSYSSCLIFNPGHNFELFYCLGKPPAKKQKKKHMTVAGGTQLQRRCTHCGVQKTPQWRTGPLGAKTLCNACGVRFKSGRLLPEYRPACSPTFSSDVHSNNHRKVLEMRRKKEITRPEPGFAPAVQSF